MWTQLGNRWCISVEETAMCMTNHVPDEPAVNPQNEKHFDMLICTNQKILTKELCTEQNFLFQYAENNINKAKFVPSGSHRPTQTNKKTTKFKSLRTIISLKVEVSLVKRYDVHITSWNQQLMEWQHVNTPLRKTFKTQGWVGKVLCTVFWDGEIVMFLNFQELQEAELLNFQIVETNLSLATHYFEDHVTNLDLTILPCLPFHLDLTLSYFYLFGPMKDGLYR